jgi:hypothetical protein
VFPLWSDRGWDALLIEGDSERFKQLRKDYVKNNQPNNVNIIQSMVEPTGKNSLDNILQKKIWQKI